jgi:mannose-6-phosphate isomerase-like protein (cupin superfamily)
VNEISERPWGHYVVLDESADDFKVKTIQVTPGHRLSLQSHSKRSEHWFVVEGTGVVWLDDARVPVSPGIAVDVPVGTKHRVECTGDIPLVFVEVQHGTYFGEDDIVRHDDDYGRSEA